MEDIKNENVSQINANAFNSNDIEDNLKPMLKFLDGLLESRADAANSRQRGTLFAEKYPNNAVLYLVTYIILSYVVVYVPKKLYTLEFLLMLGENVCRVAEILVVDEYVSDSREILSMLSSVIKDREEDDFFKTKEKINAIKPNSISSQMKLMPTWKQACITPENQMAYFKEGYELIKDKLDNIVAEGNGALTVRGLNNYDAKLILIHASKILFRLLNKNINNPENGNSSRANVTTYFKAFKNIMDLLYKENAWLDRLWLLREFLSQAFKFDIKNCRMHYMFLAAEAEEMTYVFQEFCAVMLRVSEIPSRQPEFYYGNWHSYANLAKECRSQVQSQFDKKNENAAIVLESLTIKYREILLAKIIGDIFDVLGEAPCDYALVAMGSFARNEVTYCSDLEFALFYNEKVDREICKSYFEEFFGLFEYKIISFGETDPASGFSMDLSLNPRKMPCCFGNPLSCADNLAMILEGNEVMCLSMQHMSLISGKDYVLDQFNKQLTMAIAAKKTPASIPWKNQLVSSLLSNLIKKEITEIGYNFRGSASNQDGKISIKDNYTGLISNIIFEITILNNFSGNSTLAMIDELLKAKLIESDIATLLKACWNQLMLTRLRIQQRDCLANQKIDIDNDQLITAKDRIAMTICDCIWNIPLQIQQMHLNTVSIPNLKDPLHDILIRLTNKSITEVSEDHKRKLIRGLIFCLMQRRYNADKFSNAYAKLQDSALQALFCQEISSWSFTWPELFSWPVENMPDLAKKLSMIPNKYGLRVAYIQASENWNNLVMQLVDVEAQNNASCVTLKIMKANEVREYTIKDTYLTEIFSDARKFVLQPKKNNMGRHQLIALETPNGIIWVKIKPSMPSNEYFVNEISWAVAGGGTPFNSTVAFCHYNAAGDCINKIAALLIEDAGQNAVRLRDATPEIKNSILSESYTSALIRAILVNPEDDRSEDYFCVPQNNGYALVKIDNERAFFPSVKNPGKKNAAAVVKSAIFSLPQAYLTVDQTRLMHLRLINANCLLQRLLEQLIQYHNLSKELFADEDIKNHFQNINPSGSILATLVHKHTPLMIYNSLKILQTIARNPKDVNAMYILVMVDKELAIHYQEAFSKLKNNKDGNNNERIFDRVAQGQYEKMGPEGFRVSSMNDIRAQSTALELPNEITMQEVVAAFSQADADLAPLAAKKHFNAMNKQCIDELERKMLSCDLQVASEFGNLPSSWRNIIITNYHSRKDLTAGQIKFFLNVIAKSNYHSIALTEFSRYLSPEIVSGILKKSAGYLVRIKLTINSENIYSILVQCLSIRRLREIEIHAVNVGINALNEKVYVVKNSKCVTDISWLNCSVKSSDWGSLVDAYIRYAKNMYFEGGELAHKAIAYFLDRAKLSVIKINQLDTFKSLTKTFSCLTECELSDLKTLSTIKVTAPLLRMLTIKNAPRLVTLDFENLVMDDLRSLHLEFCSNLREININESRLLESLYLKNCEALNSVIISSGYILRHLRVLKIINCKSLNFFDILTLELSVFELDNCHPNPAFSESILRSMLWFIRDGSQKLPQVESNASKENLFESAYERAQLMTFLHHQGGVKFTHIDLLRRFNIKDLHGWDIPGADLTGIDFDGSSLCNANLSCCKLIDMRARNADFSNAKFHDAQFFKSEFSLNSKLLFSENRKGSTNLSVAGNTVVTEYVQGHILRVFTELTMFGGRVLRRENREFELWRIFSKNSEVISLEKELANSSEFKKYELSDNDLRDKYEVSLLSQKSLIHKYNFNARLARISPDESVLVAISGNSEIRLCDIQSHSCFTIMLGCETKKIVDLKVTDTDIILVGLSNDSPWVWFISNYHMLKSVTPRIVAFPNLLDINVHYTFDFNNSSLSPTTKAIGNSNLILPGIVEIRLDGPRIDGATGLSENVAELLHRSGANGVVNADPIGNPTPYKVVSNVSAWQAYSLLSLMPSKSSNQLSEPLSNMSQPSRSLVDSSASPFQDEDVVSEEDSSLSFRLK